jgi:hypothetical protein
MVASKAHIQSVLAVDGPKVAITIGPNYADVDAAVFDSDTEQRILNLKHSSSVCFQNDLLFVVDRAGTKIWNIKTWQMEYLLPVDTRTSQRLF